MPLHFYTDRRVLKVVGLSPIAIADADLRALEALRVSYIVPDHAPPSPATPATAPDQLPLRREASGSSSRAGQLEGELKTLKKEKAPEEGILHRRLKNLVGEHTTLQEKYAASIRHTEVVRAELEGVQAERDSALKDRDNLRAGRDEILQTHDRLLDQVTKSQRQA
ncbi:hypothetical protein LIER_16259 [Lithospermum erythrorhizon]|uniref:Uncharacterized protein n=1 Tax=Lithospermum erythrorhizon TaxID=34254 RepID=A0AAV3Q5Z1_LITER